LLEIKRGEISFAEADACRKRLQVEFEQAFQQTTLPDRPDYKRVNAFLIHARKLTMQKELVEAIGDLMDKATFRNWLREPDDAFDGLTLIEVIERGGIDRL
jgi:hypothetical protein